MFVRRTVMGGGRKRGRRPYVQVNGNRYASRKLSQSPNLIGKQLLLRVNPELRTLEAYYEDVCFFDTLHPEEICYVRKTRSLRNDVITFAR